jgi:hypothetical protein
LPATSAFPKTNRCDRLQDALNEREGLLSTVEVPASAAFLNTGRCAFALFGASRLGFHEFLRTLLKNQQECLE